MKYCEVRQGGISGAEDGEDGSIGESLRRGGAQQQCEERER